MSLQKALEQRDSTAPCPESALPCSLTHGVQFAAHTSLGICMAYSILRMARISPSNESLGYNKVFQITKSALSASHPSGRKRKINVFCKLVGSVFLFSLSAPLLLELKALQGEKYTLSI